LSVEHAKKWCRSRHEAETIGNYKQSSAGREKQSEEGNAEMIERKTHIKITGFFDFFHHPMFSRAEIRLSETGSGSVFR
jgi:hypothetical protein